jgi:hypothetical protein
MVPTFCAEARLGGPAQRQSATINTGRFFDELQKLMSMLLRRRRTR